jgi:hypothetical protein
MSGRQSEGKPSPRTEIVYDVDPTEAIKLTCGAPPIAADRSSMFNELGG